MKHPADNLYYITYEMLYFNGACHTALQMLSMKYPEFRAGRRVGVTQDLVKFVQSKTLSVIWTLNRLLHKGKITKHTFDSARNKYYSLPPCSPKEAGVLMDVLLERAKKEKLV